MRVSCQEAPRTRAGRDLQRMCCRRIGIIRYGAITMSNPRRTDPSSAQQLALGRRVRLLRSQRGLSQERLSQVCGLHRTHVGRIERGEVSASLDSLVKLAVALDVEVHTLLMEDDAGR